MITVNYSEVYEAIPSLVKESNGLPDRYHAAGYYNQRLIEETVNAALMLFQQEESLETGHEDVLDTIDVAKELVYCLEHLHEKLLKQERKDQ